MCPLLLAANPVAGNLSLTYEREPNYFWGCGVMGHFDQIIIAWQPSSGALAGVMSRSVRPMFVNGQFEPVGYLSQLRVDRRFQGLWLVPQGMRYLRQLHADGRTRGYIATIIEGGRQATGILVNRPRRNYLNFQPVCRLWTLALILRRAKAIPTSIIRVERGSAVVLPEIIAFLQRYGPAKQFFPAYTIADFSGSPQTRDFRVEDFLLARRNGKLAGVMGLWDQFGFKQTVVQSYSGTMGRLRPLTNLGLRLLGGAPLPAPGQLLRYAFAAFICVADNDPAVFDLLLRQTYNLAGERGFAHLMVGLTEPDPLLTVARHYLHVPYKSRLYSVSWPEEQVWHQQPDGRIPYLELAAM